MQMFEIVGWRMFTDDKYFRFVHECGQHYMVPTGDQEDYLYADTLRQVLDHNC